MQEQFTVSFQEHGNLFCVPKVEDAGLRCVTLYPWLECNVTSTSDG